MYICISIYIPIYLYILNPSWTRGVGDRHGPPSPSSTHSSPRYIHPCFLDTVSFSIHTHTPNF